MVESWRNSYVLSVEPAGPLSHVGPTHNYYYYRFRPEIGWLDFELRRIHMQQYIDEHFIRLVTRCTYIHTNWNKFSRMSCTDC